MPKAEFSKIGAFSQTGLAKCKNQPQKIANYCNIFIRLLAAAVKFISPGRLKPNPEEIANLKRANPFMPSGKTHDAITFLLVAPTFAVAWKATENVPVAAIVTFGMLFGGLMFGPDLDTASKQYARWSIFRFLWYPYQVFFKHRSRWSHGLLFGTLLRVVYFLGALTLTAFAATYLVTAYQGAGAPDLLEMTKTWSAIGEYVRANVGEYAFASLFIGLWLGAASHTFTDMAGSFVKTGRITEFL